MIRTATTARGALAVLAALALGLALLACGGGGDAPAATPEATSTPAAASAAEATATASAPPATASPDATSTPEATSTASAAADGEASPAAEATAEATPEPTPSPTPEPTPTPTPTPTSTPTPQPTPRPVEAERELTGLTGWLNSEPFTIGGQLTQGRVVLIDFWTYTCINCIRTLPFLREWHDKYAEHGLVILGVHRPEFDFEHDRDNVLAAMERMGVVWPVAQDNDSRTWRAFENRFWPAKYLFGPGGRIRYEHFGEGKYRETEEKIRGILTELGRDVSAIPLGSTQPPREPNRGQTRELYGGYARNYRSVQYAAQDAYYLGGDRTYEYEDPADGRDEREHHKWYVHGLWRNEREAIVHARETSDFEDYLALRFASRSVNVVLNPPPGDPFVVVLEIDGRALTREEAGADVEWDGQGRSVIVVDEPRAYAIVELPAWGDHELKLRANSADFAMFAFTFGNYLEGA